MALTPRLELRQGQSLVMTPQLQQAIKLLQLSNLDLQAYVDGELESNPLLEPDERENRPDGETPPAEDNRDAAVNGTEVSAEITDGFDAPQDLVDSDIRLGEDAPSTEAGSDLDTDFDNIYADESQTDKEASVEQPLPDMSTENWSNPTSGSGGSLSDDFTVEQLGAQDISLRDHLSEQLPIAISDPMQRLIASDLIDSVNEAGYLGATIEGVADRLGTSMSEVEAVLAILHTLDPPGVMARDLAECLSLQLREKDRLDPAMTALLENLDLLAKREISALIKICGVDEEDILDMISEIQELNPKPGLAFDNEAMQPVVPDVFVREKADGGWHIELNNDTLPRVLVNARYFSEVKQSANKDEKNYLNECLANANWLVKSLDQRAKTILKVSTEIVKQQDGFLVHGVEHMRPLNLRTVADAIEMSESTVSRVTSNKYMATTRGVFELKYFFTSSIAAVEGGEAHSAEAVRARLKTLIDNEDPKAVLSDDKLVELLKSMGIDIARRTVAKYREALRIPSSVQRRRQKKMSA